MLVLSLAFGACGPGLSEVTPRGAEGGASAGGAAASRAPAGTGADSSPSAGSSGAPHGGGTSLASSGAAGVSTEPLGLQYFGRWDHSDPQHPSASWGPVGIRARFEGTSARLLLQDAQNTFSYAIDGGPMTTLGPTSGSEVELVNGLADGEHMLELFRRSEGGYGKTVVSGLVLDPGKLLLPPPQRPPRKLEILGDSISAGFGNEGTGGSTPLTQNGYLAYGPQLARRLNAEWSVVAHSGQGVYRNLCESLPPSAQHMPDELKLTQHPAVAGPAWDFQRYQPDVLIITLGTNDFADYPPGSCAAPSEVAFQQAYSALLSFARSSYPKAHIFALGTFVAAPGNQFGACNRCVCAAVTAANDERIHCIDPATGADGMGLVGPSDYIGDWTHPTVAGHTKLAERLEAVIRPIMGW